MEQKKAAKFVICIDNSNYPVSLEKRKIYELILDREAAEYGQVRVVDESGEDYLYPKGFFIEADVSEKTQALLSDVA